MGLLGLVWAWAMVAKMVEKSGIIHGIVRAKLGEGC